MLEIETSTMLAFRPDLVKLDRAALESSANLNRLQHLPSGVFTGIRWYAQSPNCYEGDAKGAIPAIGELTLEGFSQQLVEVIKAVKADQTTIRLQNEFFRERQSPLDTKAK